MGYVEGRNLIIEYHGADDQLDRLPALGADLVKRRVAAIAAMSGPATSAAKAATTSIPVIFFTGFDPVVTSGFVPSLNRPSGNVTGMFIRGPELIFKRLEFLHELVPAAGTITFLHTQTAIKSGDLDFQNLQQAAEEMGVKLLFIDVTKASDLDESFVRAKGEGAGALIVHSDPIFLNNRQKVLALADHYRLPAMYFIREYAAEGGLISYGPNYPDAYRRFGDILRRCLRAKSPKTCLCSKLQT